MLQRSWALSDSQVQHHALLERWPACWKST